jgi:sugar/nucleoside kinase (ribokinase family)
LQAVPALDVVGIGNALVDVITHHDDAFLTANGLVKGSMTLIDDDRALELYRVMGAGLEMSGGSAANTMVGVASFGGRAGYVGKIADDELGDVFGHDLRAVNVRFESPPCADGVPTGRSMIVVTPDGQRTMNTFLGVAALLTPDDVDESFIGRGLITYLEGYLWDRPEAMEAYRKAAAAAHAAGGQVSLTLSDSFCVERHRPEFVDLVEAQVDVLFSNDDELVALYGAPSFDEALDEVRQRVAIAAITRGAEGSVVATPDEIIKVPAERVAEVVDTTGAGDLYAAGFLYGLTHGLGLAESGRLGSLAAAEVISHVGARPLVSLRRLARL